MGSEELIARWDTFLQKIHDSYQDAVQKAEMATLEMLVESNYDYLKTMQFCAGIASQIQVLIDKIEKVWDEKVSEEMETHVSDWIEESQKGIELGERLFKELEYNQVYLEGKIARTYYDHIIQEVDKDFHCTQCKAKLEIEKNIFRSQYVGCVYCDTVNTFDPNDGYKLLGSGVIDNILKGEMLPDKRQLDIDIAKIKEQIHFDRASEEDWKVFAKKYMDYYTSFLERRATLDKDQETRLQEDISRWETHLEQNRINFNK